jgi:hypothetical protein
MINGLIEGRIIHYVLSNNEHRPGIITKVYDKNLGMCNVQIFLDVVTDNQLSEFSDNDMSIGLSYKSHRYYDDTNKRPGTWHFIERE